MPEPPFTVDAPFAKTTDEVLSILNGSPDGLTTDEAAKRLNQVGPNRLPEPPKDGWMKRFFKHFHDLLIYILIAAAVITALMDHWIDTIVILAVVVVNAIIGFIQEGKAEEALEGIRKMLSLHAHARRGGEWVEIEADDLVPGDVIRLRSGDRVPADVRLLEVANLRIEESALTGEAEPSEKQPAPVAANAGVGDRKSMAFSGSLVSAGQGTGVVTATGSTTELGRINRMIAEVESLATPLTRQMNAFSKVLSVVIVGLAALIWVLGYLLHDYTPAELFLAAIGFAVAAIPEGLPAILTITLALGVQRMARRNAITRKLTAVETLGSVTVICSDKTGTLTRNEMTARHVVTTAARYDISGTGYEPEGEFQTDGEAVTPTNHDDLQALLEVMSVCNDAEISQEENQWTLTGEPTEGALRTLGRKADFDHAAYERLAVIPFESETKFMATLNRVPGTDTARILLKGAPDRLLDRCAQQRGADGTSEPLDRDFWEQRIDDLSGEGLRVLAAAARDAEPNPEALDMEALDEGMVFLGIVGIIDPPRPEAIEAIRICRDAGIRVKMITGDHAGTAKAIGYEMGIGDGQHAVTGAELEVASDEELRTIAQENDIFARTSPEHKLRLVKALQANQEVVAMTGDGVNDAPALKRADVGVAMGIKGSEATKEAADIVLADDNFTSIERAVEEGRTIYDNLRKAILFILPTNGAEALVVLTAVVLGLQLPLTPVQILWVNMVTSVTLALALAFEPSEPGLMRRPPREPGASILGGALLWRIAFVSLLIGGATTGLFLWKQAEGIEVARTMAVNMLVIGQAFYLFNSRYLNQTSLTPARLMANPVAWMALGALVVMQLAFVYVPLMQHAFGSAALTARQWLLPLGLGFIAFLVVEAEKKLVHGRPSDTPPEDTGEA